MTLGGKGSSFLFVSELKESIEKSQAILSSGLTDSAHPLGTIYTPSDYSLFDAMNDKISFPYTKGEVLTQREWILKVPEIDTRDPIKRMQDDVAQDAGVVITLDRLVDTSITGPILTFGLYTPPVKITVMQYERRTHILFPPKKDLEFSSARIKHFVLHSLPQLLYGKGPHCPSTDEVINSTTASVISDDEKSKEFKFFYESEIVGFEQAMKDTSDIYTVEFDVQNDMGVSYRILIPNKEINDKGHLLLSLPSRSEVPQSLVQSLMEFHELSPVIRNREYEFGVRFSYAINKIRETATSIVSG